MAPRTERIKFQNTYQECELHQRAGGLGVRRIHGNADRNEIVTRDAVGLRIGQQFGGQPFAPNAIELHPILAICFGQDCDPLSGY